MKRFYLCLDGRYCKYDCLPEVLRIMTVVGEREGIAEDLLFSSMETLSG